MAHSPSPGGGPRERCAEPGRQERPLAGTRTVGPEGPRRREQCHGLWHHSGREVLWVWLPVHTLTLTPTPERGMWGTWWGACTLRTGRNQFPYH